MLQSIRALVIEREYLIAVEIQQMFEDLGISEVELFASIEEAQANWERISSASVAVVEGHLGAQAVIDFTARLAEAGVAIVIASADRSLAVLFPHAQFIEKPFDDSSVRAAFRAALSIPS